MLSEQLSLKLFAASIPLSEAVDGVPDDEGWHTSQPAITTVMQFTLTQEQKPGQQG